jgi:hypothetical protein
VPKTEKGSGTGRAGQPGATSGAERQVAAGNPGQPLGMISKKKRGVLDTSLPLRVGAVWKLPCVVVGKIAEYLCFAEGDVGGASGLFRLNAPSIMPDWEVALSPREMAFEEMLCWLFPSPAMLSRMRSLQFGLDRLQMAMLRTTDLAWGGGCQLGSTEISRHEDYCSGLDWQMRRYMQESHVITMEAEIGRKIFMQQEWGVMCGWWETLFQVAAADPVPPINTIDPNSLNPWMAGAPDGRRGGRPPGWERGGGSFLAPLALWWSCRHA